METVALGQENDVFQLICIPSLKPFLVEFRVLCNLGYGRQDPEVEIPFIMRTYKDKYDMSQFISREDNPRTGPHQ